MTHKNTDEDDKPTAVIEVLGLKNKVNGPGPDLELEFSSSVSGQDLTGSLLRKALPEKRKVVLFDLTGDFFSSFEDYPSHWDYQIAKSPKELSAFLKKEAYDYVLFYLDPQPKGINQLMAQVKKFFPLVKLVLWASKLNPDKVALHKSSAAGAFEYFLTPLSNEKMTGLK